MNKPLFSCDPEIKGCVKKTGRRVIWVDKLYESISLPFPLSHSPSLSLFLLFRKISNDFELAKGVFWRILSCASKISSLYIFSKVHLSYVNRLLHLMKLNAKNLLKSYLQFLLKKENYSCFFILTTLKIIPYVVIVTHWS